MEQVVENVVVAEETAITVSAREEAPVVEEVVVPASSEVVVIEPAAMPEPIVEEPIAEPVTELEVEIIPEPAPMVEEPVAEAVVEVAPVVVEEAEVVSPVVEEPVAEIVSDSVIEESAFEPEVEEVVLPVAEEPVVEEIISEPVAEEVIVEEAPAPVVEAPETYIYGELALFGETASISMYETIATVEYPENIIYESDIVAFIEAIGPNYQSYLEGVTYRIFPEGKAEIYYPAISKEFRFEILAALEKEILGYVDTLFAPEPVEEVVPEPAPEPEVVVEEPAPELVVEVVEPEPVKVEVVAPAPVVETKSVVEAPAVVDPILDSDLDYNMLSILGIFVVLVVLFTAAVAIRNANKERRIPRGLSFLLAVLFTALSWVISTIVNGYSDWNLLYLILLLTYFVFRSKGSKN